MSSQKPKNGIFTESEYAQLLGSRVRDALSKNDLTQKKAAQELGMAQNTLSNYINGKRIPKAHVLVRISQFCDVPVGWLAAGEGTMYRDERAAEQEETGLVESDGGALMPAAVPEVELPAWAERPADEVALERMTYAPFYEAPAGAGSGGNADLIQVRSYMAFDDEWLRREARIDPKRAFVAQVYGSSMADKLTDGDLVLCEYHQAAIDGIMTVRHEGQMYIKYVIERREQIRLMSENPRFPDIEVREGDDFQVMGRAVRKVVRV